MRRVKEIREEDLQAFFRACKRNGVSVSSTPRPHNRRSSVIVGVNGERYRITPDMRKVLEQSGTSHAPGVSVIHHGSHEMGLSKPILGERTYKSAFVRGCAKRKRKTKRKTII